MEKIATSERGEAAEVVAAAEQRVRLAPARPIAPSQNETEQIHPVHVHRPLPPRSRAAASRPPPRLRTGRRDQRLKGEEGRTAGIAARKDRAMGLLSCVGRVLFASFFLISAYREACKFGSDGGPAAKSLEPKFNLFLKQVSTNTGMAVPHIHIKTITATTLFLKGYGGGLLILNLSLGAFLLLVYLAFITPVMCDFYNYEMGSPQFVQLFTQFSQNLALYGALLFFMGMKTSIPRRKSKRRTVKTKTT